MVFAIFFLRARQTRYNVRFEIIFSIALFDTTVGRKKFSSYGGGGRGRQLPGTKGFESSHNYGRLSLVTFPPSPLPTKLRIYSIYIPPCHFQCFNKATIRNNFWNHTETREAQKETLDVSNIIFIKEQFTVFVFLSSSLLREYFFLSRVILWKEKKHCFPSRGKPDLSLSS